MLNKKFQICLIQIKIIKFPDSDSVMVHVIKSEHRAAMQHENNGAYTSIPSRILLLIGLLSTTIYATTRTVGKQIGQLLECPIVILACLYSVWRWHLLVSNNNNKKEFKYLSDDIKPKWKREINDTKLLWWGERNIFFCLWWIVINGFCEPV